MSPRFHCCPIEGSSPTLRQSRGVVLKSKSSGLEEGVRLILDCWIKVLEVCSLLDALPSRAVTVSPLYTVVFDVADSTLHKHRS